MSIELVSLVSILAVFSLYGLLSGIELGIALMRLQPKLVPERPAIRIFTPRWEITNILLVLGCVGLSVLFNDAADMVIEATWPVLLLGLLALVVRAVLLAYLVLQKSVPGGRLLNYLFAAVSFIVPVSLGAAGIYMVTGAPFWQTDVGLTFFACLLVGLAALGASFLYYIGGRRAPQGVVLVSRILNMVLAGLLAIVLLGVLSSGGSHLFNLSYAYLAVIAAGIGLMQSVCMASGKEWRMWWCLAALTVLAPFLLGLANYPYLIYPYVTVSTSFAL